MSSEVTQDLEMATADRPLRRDAERNRLRILEAAAELFQEQGLGVTLNDIAHHAGVGVGTVYRRYPDKELLIDALFEQHIGEIVTLAQASLDDPQPWRGLVGFLEGVLERQADNQGLKEVLLGSPRGTEHVCFARDRLEPLLAKLVRRAVDAGELRADVGVTDLAVVQMMLGTVADCSREVEPDLWRRYLQVMLRGLRSEPLAPDTLVTAGLESEQLDQVMGAWRPSGR